MNWAKMAYLLYIRHVELFTRLSLINRLLSSNASLMAVTPSTNITGSIEISLPNALIDGTQFSNTINKKYKFANRWNCSKRFFGRNVSTVYFVVLWEEKIHDDWMIIFRTWKEFIHAMEFNLCAMILKKVGEL